MERYQSSLHLFLLCSFPEALLGDGGEVFLGYGGEAFLGVGGDAFLAAGGDAADLSLEEPNLTLVFLTDGQSVLVSSGAMHRSVFFSSLLSWLPCFSKTLSFLRSRGATSTTIWGIVSANV